MAKSAMSFAGQRILVTGASGGIGREVARILAGAGASLVLSARNVEKLEALAAELSPKTSCEIAPYDIVDGDGIPAWLRGLAEKGGAFSGIAHIAGVYHLVPLRGVTPKMIEISIQTNVTSALMLGRGLRQKNCHVQGSSLVLVGSTAALRDGGANIVYAATKGAVTAAAKGMANELMRDGIRVNCVVPGSLNHDMLRGTDIVPTEFRANIRMRYPLGYGEPEDPAQAIVFLLSDRAKWITGTALQIDGGLSLGIS